MYYMLLCLSPDDAEHVMLAYEDDDPDRSWHSGARFDKPPKQPILVEIDPDFPGVLPEFTDEPVPLMSKRLLKALQDAGVTNVDAYQAEILDPTTKKRSTDHVAVNIVGKIAAADLSKSDFDATIPERMISMDFNSVTIDEAKTRGAFLFRLAESVNAIVVHEKVKQRIEQGGIDTLTFVPPEQWAG